MQILFVCSGNVCRSAMAEALFRKKIVASGKTDVTARSCGTRSSPLYKVPPVVVRFLAERDLDVSHHRSTQIDRALVASSDMIFVMERHHEEFIVKSFPEAKDKVFLLKAYAGALGDPEIPDPIGGPDEEYVRTGREIESYIETIFEKILTYRRMPMSYISKQDPEVFKAMEQELDRQRYNLELIASENHTSPAVLEAQGSVLTNKYAEGYPGKRYYGGCEYVDIVETIAIERAKKLFGAEHANVQAHSGTEANIAAYVALVNYGDTVMGMSLAHGGHLSHGHPLNFSGKYYKIVPYSVRKDTEEIDYEEVERLAKEHKPKMIMTGASAYSKTWDWARFRKIADSVGAYLVADMAHYAGLIATGIYPSPVPYADIVTTTTHKTLRGPRAGLILCKAKHAQAVDKAVFPGIQGGPLMHVVAAKAVALGEALQPDFKAYQEQILKNARAFAAALTKEGLRIVSGGTDCHMFLVDLRPLGITGKDAQHLLDKVRITVNKNAIPYDPEKPGIASGIRIGTPAVTTRGLKEKEMEQIAHWIVEAFKNRNDEAVLSRINADVRTLCDKFPLYRDMK